ncbi:MAG: ABC transporter permease [Chloroflexi bacterium]|nr:MAG: ABC transporter permease [Chloroflexota bacterium]RLT34072.1 MAG: ABC transporter permease [Chloroflexota bacterium]
MIGIPLNERKPANLWRDAAIRFSRNKLAVGALFVVAMFVFMAIFADVISPSPYDKTNLTQSRKFPSWQYPLGTDTIGRDQLSRIIYGARVSLSIGLSVQLLAVVIGVSMGAAAGFLGGWVDTLVMGTIEVFTAIPQLLFALFLLALWGGGITNIIIALGIISWIEICRLTRAQILSLREKEYIESARAIGVTNINIAIKHLLPNALSPLIISFTLGIPATMFAEAGLSFLGIGINDPMPSWGKMAGQSFGNIEVYWHLGLFPTLMIALTMLSFSFVGDGLRDALDPRLRK